jgi:hypothetical protein
MYVLHFQLTSLLPPPFKKRVSRIGSQKGAYVRATLCNVPSGFQTKLNVKSNSLFSPKNLIAAIVPSGFHVNSSLQIFLPVGALVKLLKIALCIDSPPQTLMF